ncbi:MAG: GAF domain-containing protein [Blastocatellia bacterium]
MDVRDATVVGQFARALCSAQDYHSLLATVVGEVCQSLDAENTLLWLYDDEHGELCCEASRHSLLGRASAREIRPGDAPVLDEVLQTGEARVIEDFQSFQHGSVVEGAIVRTAILAPLRHRARVVGVLEAVNKLGASFNRNDASLLDELAAVSAPLISAWREQEASGAGMLRALTRLTLLYDVTQSFNSTIELEELAPIICNRTANVMDVESSSLWLVSKQEMVCRAVFGHYSAEIVGYAEAEAGTVVGDMMRDDAPLIVNSADDPRLASRLPHLDNGSVKSLVCSPIKHEGRWLGALEIINRRDRGTFTEADSHLLIEVAAQAANSIRNAQRHEAERKVKELQALLRTSREITSSLDLDRMLSVVVNQTATIIPFDRCAIALLNKGRYNIDAIAGETEVNRKDPKVKEWNEVIGWAGETGTEIYVSEEDGQIDSDRAETREKFQAHFQASETRSFYSLPLTDEEGQLGVLALESKTPRFLSASHLELLKIFAGQATVAIRNAQLYRQVPLIGALEPFAEKKRAFLAMPKAKRAAIIAIGAALLLVLIFFPLQLKVGGSAYVLPTRTAPVSAEVDGIIERVNYREGDLVPTGAVVATLRSEEYLLNLNNARSRYDMTSRELTRLQAVSGPAAAQIERVKLDQAQREIALYQEKLEQTQIRAPITGVIVTPRLDEKRGRFIRRGEAFCETADTNPVVIEAAIAEDDIGLVQPAQEVWLKANTFPGRKFIGRVTRISPQATVEQDARVFIVRSEIDNPENDLRTGMVGRAKILTGSRSVGYLLLREPLRWLQKTTWSWLP